MANVSWDLIPEPEHVEPQTKLSLGQWIHLPVAVAITLVAVLVRAVNPSDFGLLGAYYLGAAMHTTIAWGTAIRQSRLERQRFRHEVETETLPAVESRILAGVDRRLEASEGRIRANTPVLPDPTPRFTALETTFKEELAAFEDRLPDPTERIASLELSVRQEVTALSTTVQGKLESFDAKAGTITSRLDLTDQKLALSIDTAMGKVMPGVEDRLSARMNQLINAALARQAHEAEAALRQMGGEMVNADPKARLLVRALGRVAGKQNAEAILMLKDYLDSKNPAKQHQLAQQSAGSGPPPGFTAFFGVSPQCPSGFAQWNGQSWQPIPDPRGPQPAYPGHGPAPAFPGGPMIPTPGAGAPPGYQPTLEPGVAIVPPGLTNEQLRKFAPPLPPPPGEVDAEAKAAGGEGSSEEVASPPAAP